MKLKHLGQNIFETCILTFELHVSFANMEAAGFTTYTAATHQGAIEALWPFVCRIAQKGGGRANEQSQCKWRTSGCFQLPRLMLHKDKFHTLLQTRNLAERRIGSSSWKSHSAILNNTSLSGGVSRQTERQSGMEVIFFH